MLIQNLTDRLITLNIGKDSFRLLPGSEAVEIKESISQDKFYKILLDKKYISAVKTLKKDTAVETDSKTKTL